MIVRVTMLTEEDEVSQHDLPLSNYVYSTCRGLSEKTEVVKNLMKSKGLDFDSCVEYRFFLDEKPRDGMILDVEGRRRANKKLKQKDGRRGIASARYPEEYH